MPEWIVFCIGLAIIIGATSISKYIKVRAEQGLAADQQQHYQFMEQRLTEVERRLSDIQEVVLAIDEKLEHLEMKQAKE